MRKTTLVLLAVLSSSCGAPPMADKEWDRLQRENTLIAGDKWGLVGHEWNEKKKGPAGTELGDEIRWGAQQVVTIDASLGTGIFAKDSTQLIQVTRPARTFNLNLSFSLPNTVALPALPNFEVTVTFIVQLGIGSAYITRYEQLFSADLIAFAPDPSFPTRTVAPIVSEVITDLPAKQIIVTAHVEYQRILLAGPPIMPVLVTAAAAPVFRM